MTENNFPAEFRKLRKTLDMTQQDVAELFDVSIKTVSNYESGTTRIPVERIEKLRSIAVQKSGIGRISYGGEDFDDTKQKYTTMPLIPFNCLAGLPADDNEGVSLEQFEQYSVPEFSIRGAEFLIRVEGMSMFPRYTNGDILAVKRLSSVTFFQWGCVYVLDTEQGMLIKRLFKSSNPDNITCHSENSVDFLDFEIPKSEIRSVLIVLGRISLC